MPARETMPGATARLDRRRRTIDRRRERIRAELDEIERERADIVYALHTTHGLSHQQIADLFGISKGRAQQLVKLAERRAAG